MMYNQKYAITVMLLGWLSFSTTYPSFFHNEEKALDKIDKLIIQLHPDNYVELKHALHIAYKGMQVGIEAFFKNVQKVKLQQCSSNSLVKTFFNKFSRSISSLHGIEFGSLYRCSRKAENKISMYYLAFNTDLLFNKLTPHDQQIFKEIFQYCIVKKDKNPHLILLSYGLSTFVKTNVY